MAAKDILLHAATSQVPVPGCSVKLKFLTVFDKKACLDAEIFFGFSNSELINDNTFSLKDLKKKRYRDFKSTLR